MMKKKQTSSPDVHIYQYFAATLLPAAILLGIGFIYITALNTDISFSKSKLAILPGLQPLYEDTLNLQKIRGLQYLLSTTNDHSFSDEISSLQKKSKQVHQSIYAAYPHIEEKYCEINDKVELAFSRTNISGIKPDEVFDNYSLLIFEHFIFLQDIAKESSLLLDSDLNLFTLVEISVIRIPAITEIIGQLRGRSSAWLYTKNIEEHREQIEYLFDSARKELKLLQTIIASLSRHKNNEHTLNLNIATISNTLSNYLSQFYSALQHTPSKQQGKILFVQGSEVIDSIRLFNMQVIETIRLQLEQRIQKQHNKQLAAMFSILLAIFSMAYFISKFYQRNKVSFISEVKARKNLILSETRQRAIVDTMADGLITIDQSGRIQDFNPAAENMFGHKASKIIGKNVNILMPEPYHSEHNHYLSEYIKTGNKNLIGTSRELSALRKDGSIFPIELSVTEIILEKEKLFSGIIRDISERKHIARMKDEFISSVSHELRTPLTSIRGALSLINGGVVGKLPEQSLEMFNIAYNNTDHLLVLINDILDIQKITSGKMEFKFEVIEIMPFLQEIIHDNAVYGAENDIHFIFNKSLSEPKILADRHRLQQVMDNLLSNAAKFSGKSKTVEINVSQNEHTIKISVTDRGYGIADKFKDQVFERFTQSEASATQKIKGSGLGLSIAKVLIEKQGGSIGFISKEGLGSMFYIELPEYEDSQKNA